MDKPRKIEPAKGKLGVLLPGMGAVSTTFMAGVELVRKGESHPVGSLTQLGTIRLGKRTDGRSPQIKKLVPLGELNDLVFAGWDIYKDNAFQSAANAGVLSLEDLAKVKPFLSNIKPMKAAFDPEYVKKLNGPNVKKGKNKYELALKIKEDIANFRKTSKVSRLVTCWCGSTEIFLKPEEVHSTPEKFVEAMKANHPSIAPSMLYAWASITSGVPFANGAPNLTVDFPAMQQLALEHNVAICGKDFKTGQTLMKTVLAPAFKARMLGLSGWFSTNILGNRDGEVLEDPGSFKTKEESKLGALEYILQPELVSRTLREDVPQSPHQLLSTARRQQRGLGQHRYFRVARLSDADQGGFPLPGLDPGSADCPGFSFVPGSGAARGPARHSGMVEFLFQVAHDRPEAVSRTRPLHPTNEAEKHVTLDDGRGPDHALRPRILRLASVPGVPIGLAGIVRMHRASKAFVGAGLAPPGVNVSHNPAAAPLPTPIRFHDSDDRYFASLHVRFSI